jgi:hypothetical protein
MFTLEAMAEHEANMQSICILHFALPLVTSFIPLVFQRIPHLKGENMRDFSAEIFHPHIKQEI